MRTDDFDYYLDEELIAQTPLDKRDNSRLMLVDKKTGFYKHEHFYNIINYLNPGDVLVLNNTRVIPARIIGEKESTGAVIELLLLKDLGNIWECLVKPSRRIKKGDVISFGNGLLKAECVLEKDEGIKHFKFIYEGILLEILEELGTMPLPPYIHEKLDNPERYQTVYSKINGSSAAPTAGLHFTEELLKKISDKGIEILYVTLHVGLGTFRPVKVDNVLEHKMHSEYYEMNEEVASRLNLAKKEKRKIIAVGTTTTRVLETIYHKYNRFTACSGDTDIFIYPGFEFKAIDSLITNFHLPKSTLVMLVSAFAGKDNILNSYKIAVDNKYRFFSFGDSMMIGDFNNDKDEI
jgi:S-adenosylmethionine:tRNA ribosyltransferase-isomerase